MYRKNDTHKLNLFLDSVRHHRLNTQKGIKMNKVNSLELQFFKHSYSSFIKALDSEGIPHKKVQCFSSPIQASSFLEVIHSIAETMPWNSLAKLMVAWIDARKSREIIVNIGDMKSIHIKGYSVSDVEKIISSAENAIIIDTLPENEDSK